MTGRRKESSSVNCWDSDITKITLGKKSATSSDAGSEAAMLPNSSCKYSSVLAVLSESCQH